MEMPTLVCAVCCIPMRPKKNGVDLACHIRDGSYYYTVSADLYVCPKCGHEVVTGFGQQPFHRATDSDSRPEADFNVQLEPMLGSNA